MFTAEDARIVRADQLNVRALGCPPDAEALDGFPRVAVDVDGREPEPGELVHHPGCRQPSERVVDAQRLQPPGEDPRELDAAAAEVTGQDVMTVETVVLSPGVKQQVRIPRAQLTFAALKQELIIEA